MYVDLPWRIGQRVYFAVVRHRVVISIRPQGTTASGRMLSSRVSFLRAKSPPLSLSRQYRKPLQNQRKLRQRLQSHAQVESI